jgi:hypothetical protein
MRWVAANRANQPLAHLLHNRWRSLHMAIALCESDGIGPLISQAALISRPSSLAVVCVGDVDESRDAGQLVVRQIRADSIGSRYDS